jgi:GTP-binding protein
MYKVTKAEFVTSAADKSQFLKSDKPIIAICGKSNVGKSSFINALAGRNKLAKVSKDPGRTRLVNYFDFGDFLLADLPGYGFARVSKEEKAKWGKLLESFFADRCATHALALCDIRHDPTVDDRQMIEYLYYNIIPFTVVATKLDKVSKAEAGRNVSRIAAIYKCGASDIIATSSQTKQGFDKILERIESIIAVDRGEGDNEE